MELTGKVKWFDTKKGFGFIQPGDSGGDVFVHFGDIEDENERMLEPGQAVKFELGETLYGRRALRVRKVADEPGKQTG